MEDGNKELRELNDSRIDKAEIWRDLVVDTIGIYGPLAIPLVPAGLTLSSIGVNYEKLLGFPKLASWSIGGLGGVGIEIFGIIANENYLDMVRYNQTIQPGEELAPVDEAKDARDLYVKIVMGLLTTLEFIPAIAGLIAHYSVKAEAAMQIISTISVLVSLYPLAYLAVLTARVIIMRKQQKARMRVRRNRQEEEDKANVIAELEAKVLELSERVLDAEGEAKTIRTIGEGLASKLSQAELEYRKLEIEAEGLRRELRRTEARAIQEDSGVSEPAEPAEDGSFPRFGAPERRKEVLRLLKETSAKHEANFAEWGRTFGVSDTAIRGDLQWLIKHEYWENHGEWKPTPKAADLLGS